MADSENVNQSKKWAADASQKVFFYQALFSFRLARQNVTYKAKRKLSLANLELKTFFFHVTEFFV